MLRRVFTAECSFNIHASYQSRLHIAQLVIGCIGHQWAPFYESTYAFLRACREDADPLHVRYAVQFRIRTSLHLVMQNMMMQQLVVMVAKWKAECLPPPRVNQSQVSVIHVRAVRLNRYS